MLVIRKWDNFGVVLEVTGYKSLVAPDLSECTVRFRAQRKIAPTELLKPEDTLFVKTIANPESNLLGFYFSPAETGAMPEGDYIGTIKFFFDNGIEQEMFVDQLKVAQGIFNE